MKSLVTQFVYEVDCQEGFTGRCSNIVNYR